MDELQASDVSCPYCGELINVLVDPQEVDQQYIEDCQVCCKPIVFLVSLSANGALSISAHDENESI